MLKDWRNKRKREQYAALTPEEKSEVARKRRERYLVGKARNTLERTLNTNTHVDDALTSTDLHSSLAPLPQAQISSEVGNFSTLSGKHGQPVRRGLQQESIALQSGVSRYQLLPRAPPCCHCGAYKFYRETANFCCSAGSIRLAETVLPDFLIELITGTDARSREFHNMIRTCNNNFAYSSMGIHCDPQLQQRNCGIYTVRVQGQVHHFLNDLLPSATESKLSGFQFYFFDPEHQATNRVNQLPRLDVSIVARLVETMEQNPYTLVLHQLSSIEEYERYCIHIRSDPGLDLRVYNRPKSSEVAGIWIEEGCEGSGKKYDREVKVYARSGHSHIVHGYYGCYDPLQYVLMFPHGEPGWHGSIPLVDGTYDPPIHAGPCTQQSSGVPHYNTFKDDLAIEEAEIELPNLLTDYSVSFSRDLLDQGLVNLCTLQQIIATQECRDYWTRSSMQMSLDDQKLFYIGCSNCFAKVNSLEGVDYTCMLCKKDVTSAMSLVVSMDVFDSTGRVTAGAIELVAEEILQTTTADLSRLIKLGIRYDLNTIRAELENKEFLILLRRTYSRGTRRISRLLLVAFFDETVDGRENVANLSQTAPRNVSSLLGSSECLASTPMSSPFSQNKSPNKSFLISPLKRQMDGIMIGTGADGSPAKKQLTFGANATQIEDDGVPSTTIEFDTSVAST